jgi:hypothetical protein
VQVRVGWPLAVAKAKKQERGEGAVSTFFKNAKMHVHVYFLSKIKFLGARYVSIRREDLR